MANKPITMLQVRRILQLKCQGATNRQVSGLTGLARKTVNRYVKAMEGTSKTFEELLALSDEELTKIVYPAPCAMVHDARYQDFQGRLEYLISELQNTRATRMILWEEYRREYPEGYSYSQFCERLSRAMHSLDAVMHFEHKPGDYLFFDFAGDKLSYIDFYTGEVIRCPVFIGVLPFSGYTYVEAMRNETRGELILALNNCLQYIGGVPRCVKSDNLGTWVKRANRYEPEFSEYARQWSFHYNTTLMATRVRKPRDKASVESHVNVVYNRIYSALRNEKFFSLDELNGAIRQHLKGLNNRQMQNRDYSRSDQFLRYEKEMLGTLPPDTFIPKHKVQAKVQKSYHVLLGEDKHYYSVPHHYIGQTVTMVYDVRNVEIYLENNRIASHHRDYRQWGYTTLPEHMPTRHQCYLITRELNDKYFMEEAGKVGPQTLKAIECILQQKYFEDKTYNCCKGVLRLAGKYGKERVENACRRANTGTKITYSCIRNILEKGLDRQENHLPAELTIPEHENLRGCEAYK